MKRYARPDPSDLQNNSSNFVVRRYTTKEYPPYSLLRVLKHS